MYVCVPCIVALRLLLYRVPTQTPALFFEMKKKPKTEKPLRVRPTPGAAGGKSDCTTPFYRPLLYPKMEEKSNEN